MKNILILLACVTGLAACSTMQATDTGFLKNRSDMTTSQDGACLLCSYYGIQSQVLGTGTC